MKSKQQKQTEAIERRKNTIKSLRKTIEHYSAKGEVEGLDKTHMAEVKAQRQSMIATCESKIARHEADIKNTQKRIESGR